ncbi:TIR domain-containing protein [bacterium]|nr:TIR domain-containing protein [bacterium]
MGSRSLIEIAKRGRLAITRWRKANPEVLLNLSDADLQDVDLRGANLKRADLTGADLRGADLVGAQLGEADLTRADLRGARLVKTDCYQTRFFKATLRDAECSGAYFRRAEMTQIDLSGADLAKADLVEANLSNGSLKGATLVGADLSNSCLTGVDLREAVVGWTVFGRLDLTQPIGVEQLQHVGPSTLGIDTAVLSHGKLPPEFLRGCGISEGILQNWAACFGHPFESLTCFIRFAPDDASFAQHLFRLAQDKGLRCWLDGAPESASERRSRTSPRTYESTERILLCASKASLTSWWIEDEFERVFEREQRLKKETGRDVRLLYPLNLDGFMFGGDWKHAREKQIAKQAIDFVGWRRNEAKLDQELTKLLQTMTGEK